jgi:CheY-like chemotaxis protein
MEPGVPGGYASSVPTKSPRVLIVEDDRAIREALAECVATLGIEVVTAGDGVDGLAVLRQAPIPDAVLLDLRMPRLDGHGFLEAMHADPAVAAVPVICMSAWDDQPGFPVHASLKKPFDLDELGKLLVRLCRTAA